MNEKKNGLDPKIINLYFDCSDDHAKWVDKL